jgi:dipeptidyl aminopeptidase/acylaminoacyl peptidase
LIGNNITDAQIQVIAANPETYISNDDPPFFIQHGKLDNLVPYQQSVNLAAKLSDVIGKENVTLEIIENNGHGGPGFRSAENINKVFAFLDKYLKN